MCRSRFNLNILVNLTSIVIGGHDSIQCVKINVGIG